MRIHLPPLYSLHLKENNNAVVQLASPPISIDAQATEYSQHRVKGFVIAASGERPEILVITNSARFAQSFTHVLRLRRDSIHLASAAELDATSSRWARHPALTTPPTTLTEFESHALATANTWHDAFRYRQEDPIHNVEGLRPPQIGALHAIQAHWSVSNEPATIVLPTGVGKTETMLSALIAERCHRLLVVVPTDVLRTQIADKFISLGLLKSPRFQIVADHARYPLVGMLNRRPTDAAAVDSLFKT